MTLEPRQRAALDDYGYVVLVDVVDAGTVAVLRHAFE
jgi:ectoine hydroxylase-related dioxygenase (phytanoyl-CoA dioxygenase family)